MFSICKKYVYSESILNTLYVEIKTQMLKRFPSDNINSTKKALFFFHELQLITVLLLTCDSYMNWSTRFISLKLCVRFSIFHSVSFLLKFIFFSNKMHGLFDFKNVIISFKIKITEEPHTVFRPDLWFLTCKKKF